MHIVPFEGLKKALRHPVALGTLYRSGAYDQTHADREVPRIMCRVGRAVVGELLDPVSKAVHDAEAGLDRLRHQVPDHLPGDPRRGGDVAHDLPIATVQGESHPNDLPVPALDREDVRTPARVALKRNYLFIVRAGRSSLVLGKE